MTILSSATVTTTSFDSDWRFFRGDSVASCTGQFPKDLTGYQCFGLKAKNWQTDIHACQQSCCESVLPCDIWSFCPAGAPCARDTPGCWIGQSNDCQKNRSCPTPAPSLTGLASSLVYITFHPLNLHNPPVQRRLALAWARHAIAAELHE